VTAGRTTRSSPVGARAGARALRVTQVRRLNPADVGGHALARARYG